MDKEAKRQYMETIRKEYLKANKKRKGEILDEYCKRTGENRKYAIRKFKGKVKIKKPNEKRKPRKWKYDGRVIVALVELWNIFDKPCGQRLKPMIEKEIDRLRKLKEIKCEDETADYLKKMSSATIDRRLQHEKEVLRFNLKKNKKREDNLLSLIPTKTSSEIDRTVPGIIQIDCVEHCGANVSGEYGLSLSSVDVYSGWWEAGAVLGKGQRRALRALRTCKEAFPVSWKEMHPDNGRNILNWHVYEFARQEGIELSRSRPYKKNDNCFIEQKQSTHVRRVFGHFRFDTPEELEIISDLYRNELRLYKNFFQPVMKLKEKVRVKGKLHRKYDKPKTPYERLMESEYVSDEVKEELKKVYDSLNPAELKRKIDGKLKKLIDAHYRKNGKKISKEDKKALLFSVTNYMMKQL